VPSKIAAKTISKYQARNLHANERLCNLMSCTRSIARSLGVSVGDSELAKVTLSNALTIQLLARTTYE